MEKVTEKHIRISNYEYNLAFIGINLCNQTIRTTKTVPIPISPQTRGRWGSKSLMKFPVNFSRDVNQNDDTKRRNNRKLQLDVSQIHEN